MFALLTFRTMYKLLETVVKLTTIVQSHIAEHPFTILRYTRKKSSLVFCISSLGINRLSSNPALGHHLPSFPLIFSFPPSTACSSSSWLFPRSRSFYRSYRTCQGTRLHGKWWYKQIQAGSHSRRKLELLHVL